MRLSVPQDVALKEPRHWKLIGKRLPRLDSVAKTTGKATFSMDMRRPRELIAMVRRPDVFGAKVRSFDDSYAMTVPGVVGSETAGSSQIAMRSWRAGSTATVIATQPASSGTNSWAKSHSVAEPSHTR